MGKTSVRTSPVPTARPHGWRNPSACCRIRRRRRTSWMQRPTEGTCAPRLRLPLAWVAPTMHAWSSRRPPASCCCFCCHVRCRCRACWPGPACCYGTHAPTHACGGRQACFASRTHVGIAAPEGTISVCVHFPCLVMQHLQHKAFSTTYVRSRWNIYKHTLATYVYGHCNIYNI
jgi:hypothetical protein